MKRSIFNWFLIGYLMSMCVQIVDITLTNVFSEWVGIGSSIIIWIVCVMVIGFVEINDQTKEEMQKSTK